MLATWTTRARARVDFALWTWTTRERSLYRSSRAPRHSLIKVVHYGLGVHVVGWVGRDLQFHR
eukprot:2229489-Prymnesium_polylepis.1